MRKGFTLVELSIALVIIGLLIGGILAAQSMISTVKIQGIIREEQQYEIAIRGFREEFGGFPGDSIKAAQSLGGPSGNDDNIVQYSNAGTYEAFNAWQQLALAGFLPGSYTGSASGVISIPGVNVPESKVAKGAMWVFEEWTLGYPGTEHSGMTHLRVGNRGPGRNGVTCETPWVGPFTASEALAIDSKMDDGKPATGKVGAAGPWGCLWECASDNTLSAVYNVNDTSKICVPVFWLNLLLEH